MNASEPAARDPRSVSPPAAAPVRAAIRVALAQVAPKLGDRDRNLQLHADRIAAARQAGADLIIFPELSLTGYFLRDMVPDLALSRGSPEITGLLQSADAAVVFGFVEQSPQQRFYNSALFAEHGRIVHVHRKVYLPTYGLFDEQRYFAAGGRIQAFPTQRFGRVGLLVCEDFWHVSAAAIMQAEEVDVLICIANSPARGVQGEQIETAAVYQHVCKAYSLLLGATIILVNRVGFEDGLCFWGGSMAVGPGGKVLAEAPLFDEALAIAAIDPAELRRQRVITPLARDERLLLTLEELHRIRRRRYGD
jgi:predicted amidohydrolase